MAQWIKTLVIMLDDLNLIPGTFKVEEKKQPCTLTSTHSLAYSILPPFPNK